MRIRFGLIIASSIVLIPLLSGCGASSSIREAQDHFNVASQAEAQLSSGGDAAYTSPLGLGVYSHALANYRLAVSLLNKEIAENRAELDKDKLTGTALTLKCMALWRISDLDPAPATQPFSDPPGEEAKDCAIKADKPDIVFGTRDRILVKVIPSFVDADRGRRSTNYQDAKDRFAELRRIVGVTLNTAPEGHDVIFYLRRVQLRTLRSWREAVRRFKAPAGEMNSGNSGIPERVLQLLGRPHLGPCGQEDRRHRVLGSPSPSVPMKGRIA